MKKIIRLTAIAAAILICINTASCSGKSSYSEAGTSNNYSADYQELSEESYSTSAEGQADSESVEFEDKIIRTATVDIESDNAQKCYETLASFAKENGGGEMDFSKNSDSYENYNYITINATLKINPDKLEEFIALAEETDKVTSSSVSSNDVTEEYYDIQIRLESKKAAIENYYKLLEEAKTIQESLEIQSYITDLTAEIESMEGRLKYYDAKVDLSTIELTIRQRDKVSSVVEDEFQWDSLSLSDVGTLIKNGFLNVLNFLWSLLLWIIIIAAALSPIILIVAAVIIIVRKYRKMHPKAHKVPILPNYTDNQSALPLQPNSIENNDQKCDK